MKFEDFGLHADILQGIQDMRYESPTPIQEQAIKPIMEGKDLIANSQTGSGKTAAFLLPVMHRAMQMPSGKVRALILTPTRELAAQIDDQAMGFGYRTGTSSATIYGGVRMEGQEQALRTGTTIIIATPGRLLDHHKYGTWPFDDVKMLVLDEADRMLDMGFWPDIQSILEKLPKGIQILLFSATMPKPIVEVAKTFMHNPEQIKIGLVKPPSTIRQYLYPVADANKTLLLLDIISKKDMKSTIIFVKTKIGTNQLYQNLKRKGLAAGVIHGDLEQAQRDDVIIKFKAGIVDILVATDVASRGIDIGGISHVINFDVPFDVDTYVHRIGRTARAKADGDAYTFVTPLESERVAEIEKFIGKNIERVEIKEFQTARPGQTSPNSRPSNKRPGNSSGKKRFDPKKGGRPGQHGPRGHKPYPKKSA
ncbi:MAG: ATP-dependent RNA helicase RhlE [Candidatus Omnitrophota bacterium]|jgi:ATP-dependent RNA helicase RhlE